ncbi:uncharacterized protein BXZ73DRAFT_52910 [Epithele typhae]|uniref:uncharacterized protein n=1 Tax=Epithele typhae TaxID=378194 RepID=UPI002007D94C|nr:uncharacterized protein BXZ73DRAFT_52910 [Epithele typhae]KAH9918570.1 hypothetical protein BXZ73DRAFT_52910 [Epithele typhae]
MGKLNIAHHKSYHPYRRDNIERVRRDEEEAQLKEAAEDGRIMLADSEARMELLRQRAGVKRVRAHDGSDLEDALQKQRDEQERGLEKDGVPEAGPSSLTNAKGHINLFEDIERSEMTLSIPVRSTKRRSNDPDGKEETEKGFPLAPLAKDLNPWYSDRGHERNRELDGDKQRRDLARKSTHDPLTSINTQLASRHDPPSRSRYPASSRPASQGPIPPGQGAKADVTERLTRESSERQRAAELIRRKKREAAGSETPSTVHGGMGGGNRRYGDVFNRQAVEEVQASRQRGHGGGYGRERNGRGHGW